MSPIDWLIVFSTVVFLTVVAMRTRRHTRSVADFLSANRCAGRYLLGTAEGAAGLGAISVIAIFEQAYSTGFAPNYWNALSIPIGLFITLSGWVIYRFRETRAMTMAQFFEIRYSRNFRIFAGTLAWGAGVINFGIFPGVGARFFVSFCGLPEHNVMIGPLQISITFAVVMFLLLLIAVIFTLTGGQIAILVTDFWQGILTLCFVSVIVIFIWITVPWSTMTEGLRLGSAPERSLFDPYDIGRSDFNLGFFLIGYFFALYHFMAWQGNQGYRSSAISPHEAKMANVVGGLRSGFITLGMILMPVLAIVVMNHPDYVAVSTRVSESLDLNFPGNAQLRTQMRVPIVLREMLPVGLLGGFAASMLAFFISTHNTYMHSWGSIFIQDVLLPLRGGEPFGPERHLKYLRWSIVGVSVFIFFFSLLFPVKDYIYMFFAITGAIYLGGAGAAIIGGLYWKKGTTGAAWTAMILGSVLALSSIIAQQLWNRDFVEPLRQKIYRLEPGRPIALGGRIQLEELPDGSLSQTLVSPHFKTGPEAETALHTSNKIEGTDIPLAVLDRRLRGPVRVETNVIRTLAPTWYLLGDATGQFVARIDSETELKREAAVVVEGRIAHPANRTEIEQRDPDRNWSVLDSGRFLEVVTLHQGGSVGEAADGAVPVAEFVAVQAVKTLATIEEHLGGHFYRIQDGETQFVARLSPPFPLNGQYLAFFSSLAAIVVYIAVSLLFPGQEANLEKILHRGPYRIEEENERPVESGQKKTAWYWRMIGVNSREFTKVDKLLFLFTFSYGMYGVLGFFVLAFLQANGMMNDSRWFFWWRMSLFVQLGLAILGGLWVSIGGIFDLRKMFQRLANIDRNVLDDGRVVGDQSLADKEKLKTKTINDPPSS